MKRIKSNYGQVWLHFIDKNYSGRDEFIREAKTIGVSRAIAPQIFKKMQLGDIILLAQGDRKGSTIFGYFQLHTIIGVGPEITEELKKHDVLKKISLDSPLKVKRGCGEYTITSNYTITDPEQLMKITKEMIDKKVSTGRLMIGGTFYDLTYLQLPVLEVTTEIPFKQGFRLFDGLDFVKQINSFVLYNPNHLQVKVSGQFYVSESKDVPSSTIEATLLRIKDYQLN